MANRLKQKLLTPLKYKYNCSQPHNLSPSGNETARQVKLPTSNEEIHII